MTNRYLVNWSLTLCLSAALPAIVMAAGGTSIVATKGQSASAESSWPDGTIELVNDPVRTSGWNSWFSEWPNDVNQYAFEIKSTDDLNRLIEKLAAVRADVRQVHLSHLKEPSGLGWMTRLPDGNNIAVIFSIGDQARIDEWYKTVRKPFGVMEFTAAPVAVPPTLTVFVQNEAVNLDKLRIPAGIEVSSGHVPTVFHRFNTTTEKARENKSAVQKSDQGKQELDPAAKAAEIEITAFLKKWRSS